MAFRPAGCLIGFAALAYTVTVLATAFYNYRTLYLAGEQPNFWTMLLWQGVTYSIWMPVGAWIWRLFRREGLVVKSIAKFAVLGALLIPAHAILTVAFDVRFSAPGTIDLRSLAAQRAQLDILIFASFGVLAVAAFFQRKAAEEAAAAAEVRWALDAARRALGESHAGGGASDQLMVSVGSRRVMVRPADVEWFGSAANYVVVNWGEQEGLVRETLKALEQRLDPKLFARTHRGTIVNLSKVHTAESLSDGSWRLAMSSGAEIVVSRTYRDAILARLGGRPPPAPPES